MICKFAIIHQMHFSSLQFLALSLTALDSYNLIKKQKRYIKRIHLVTNDGLYDQKDF